jgi:hypothetical protein
MQVLLLSFTLLICADLRKWASNFSSFTGDMLHEQKSSEKLICALYNRPYVIGDIEELETMVNLAKDWSMLPILPRTIDSDIWRSYDFTDAMHLQPLKILQLATWLRNHLLFRDALCHAAGGWTTTKEDYRMEDLKQYTIVDTHHRKLTLMVTETQQELLNVIYNEESEDGNNLHLSKSHSANIPR